MIFRTFSKKQKKNVWGFRVMLGGNRIRRVGFDTKSKAEEAKVAIRKKYLNEYCGLEVRRHDCTLGELLDLRQADPQCILTRQRRQQLRKFTLFVEFAGHARPIKAVTSALLKQFRDGIITRVQHSTAQTWMQDVIAALNSSRLFFDQMENYRAPYLPALKQNSRRKIVPLSELHDVVDELRRTGYDAAADVLELLFLTGCRVNEILNLAPSAIDFERQVILLRADSTKTSQAREIPLTEASETILRKGATYPTHSWFYRMVRAAAQRRGIVFGSDNWIIHDIRRTAATKLAEAGINQSVIATLLGHSLTGMTSIYTRPTLHALRLAAEILSDAWSSNIIHFPKRQRI